MLCDDFVRKIGPCLLVVVVNDGPVARVIAYLINLELFGLLQVCLVFCDPV